ncbi:toxin [Pseudomonas sp. 22526]|uniref:toxin n=1 Tax=Pseudomonas TaxID=286 RepID=UPI00087C4284|nr:toxin [Pseudomonas chlororaphis]QQZ40101.1 toxin [Pseudomonas sp. SK3(2021)]AZD23193.1 RelE-like translational repressor toxin [Pseudomonas chlororaphis subsp. aurantiaca]AZD49369.1 RelE-like translational repressor toxin [Pseudomonas chlororaphis subsp. aurantiaca]AZD55733.1 RelE-like translational repressor toxin [Pseudomonas chlororaphis subsp. aurantiaca]AZD68124.1 RelE-like translational repressor toxin [Pseudomonas chlororaphis subsp. aurantiaca]
MRNVLTSRPIQSKIYADYVQSMDALFIELPPFQRHRQDYLDDELFRSLQLELLKAPEAGDLIEGTGGLRKIRFVDERRHKGKRGGIRVIYYWWSGGAQFWLFTLYAKNEQNDLTPHQKKLLKQLLNREVEARTHHET